MPAPIPPPLSLAVSSAQAEAATSWAGDLPALGILAGLVALVVGADLLVRGAVWVALVLGVSRMAVGLTLVAFGTSLPELLVSLTSAMRGNNDIAMANVIGSNAMNVLLIVGVAATIRAVRLGVDWLEIGYMLFATALAAVPFVLGTGVGRPLAGVMFAMVVLFCWQLLRRERRRVRQPDEHPIASSLRGWLVHLALIAIGLGMLKFGAEWLIDGSVATARHFGLSDALIGMTIVAGGTSLPELATSVVAARKGHPEIAIGNVLGSNIFNVGFVLGLCGLILPFPVDRDPLLALMWVTAGSALALALVLRLTSGVSRLAGISFLVAYGAFLAFEIQRSGG